MDDEVDPDSENVNDVLAQESSELLTILSSQSATVIMSLCQMVPGDAMQSVNHQPCSAAALSEHIKTMLQYFRVASAVECCNFLQSVCILCENIPMRLESRLMSIAGSANSNFENTSPSETAEISSSSSSPPSPPPPPPPPPSESQVIKRPRIECITPTCPWEQYKEVVMRLLVSRWESLSEQLVSEVSLENVWISPRTVSRGRDRADQTTGSTDKGSKAAETEGDYGTAEPRVTAQMFLQGHAGKVTVLMGQSGSGKSLLMSTLGQQWAHGRGPVPSSFLFVLLDFRQLNLISSPLSLSELLFQHYVLPRGGGDEKAAIMDYLLSNPEKSCWVLDGYDEFKSRLNTQELKKERLDPEQPVPVADLISGLLNHQLLPGCTLVVTCRAPYVELEGISDNMGQLLGWDKDDITKFVHNYFQMKGHQDLGKQAVDRLLSTQHLLAMAALPALCNICCICLEHLLLQEMDMKRAQNMMMKASEKEVEERSRRGRGGDTLRDLTNGGAQLSATHVQILSTLTQVYLTVLGAFLSCDQDKRTNKNTAKTMTAQESTAYLLNQYRSELRELSQLAWKSLESNKTLFVEEDMPRDVFDFSVRTGLFSKVELRHKDGTVANAYRFIHLTLHEFLAAITVMTDKDVSDEQLKKRFNLKTRWTTKLDQRTVFDSLTLYVCGLASPQCTTALFQLVRTSAGTEDQSWVSKRQTFVRKLLNKLCQRNTLTGPKTLELCHCVQESQDLQLARQFVTTRPTLELRKIRLLPSDIDALAFVVNSVGEVGIGLDFGSCSMEMGCLELLPRCQHIHYLGFHSRKYGDKFAEKLSPILPKFTSLRKLKFTGTSLTASGAASLASALQNCPHITDINLSDNNLKDDGIKIIIDVFPSLSRLESVMLGRNNSTLEVVDCLIRKMSSCLNIQGIYADGMKEVTVTFSQTSGLNCSSSRTISLLDQNWSKHGMTKLAASLACCPSLSVLDLSGGQWDGETLKTLTQFLPSFSVTKNIVLNNSCSSVDDLVILTPLLSDCASVKELHIRLNIHGNVSIVFSGGKEMSVKDRSKILRLTSCGLLPASLEKVWQSLKSPSDLTLLDLSGNRLGNKGLRKLLEHLPCLSSIQEINASDNRISIGGIRMLAEALCSHNSLTNVHISRGGREQLFLNFCPNQSHDEQQLKMFRINNSNLSPCDVTTICKSLVQCGSHFELDLSHCSLTEEAIKNLLKVLPMMVSLQRLNVSRCITSTTGALMLVGCLTVSQRVTSVELRYQSESFINFEGVTTEHVRCRLTQFSLNGDDMEKLLEVFRKAPHLSEVDLSGNQLGDKGVNQFLDSLPELAITRCANLSNNSLTQQGLLDVANTLFTCGKVSGVEVSLGEEDKCLIWFTQSEDCEITLSISESSLEYDHMTRLAQILSVSPHLTKLEFKNNMLQTDWIEEFVKLLCATDRGLSLSIDEPWIRSEEAVNLVSHCLDCNRNIHSIRVHSTRLQLFLIISPQQQTVSDNSTDLPPSVATEKIGLVDCAVQGYQLPSMISIIQKCPSLTELELDCGGAQFLCSVLPLLPNLTSLSIAGKQTWIDVKLSEALLQATSIQSLNLSGHVIGDSAAQSMSRMFPRLLSLNLSNSLWPGSAGWHLIKALGECVNLKHLCLDSLQLNEESRVHLTASLKNLNSIQSLMLKGWRIADKGIDQLTRLLPTWADLRKISLSNNLISDKSGDQLLEALNSCCHLEELYVSSNTLGNVTAARMALVLPSLTDITVIDLSENHIQEGSASLSKAIMCLKKLIKIYLTSVGTSELCGVAASLAHCPAIQDVGLGWNHCGDDVAVELARVMPLCPKLTRIDLESNSVSVVGAEALGKALLACPVLQLIRLWKNHVSSHDAHRLTLKYHRLNFSPT